MPEPITIFITTLIGLGLGASTAIIFWHEILDWAERNLFPWVERNLPDLSETVRLAFSKIDNVNSEIRRHIKEAWRRLRDYLLKQVVELQQKSSREWVKKVTSWILEDFQGGEPQVRLVTTEQSLSRDEIPNDVREAALRRGEKTISKNVTDMRDKELESLVN